MAQEQLFLIEILVDKVRFSLAYDELPDQNDISVTATFGKFATLEIVSGDLAKTFKSAVDPILRDISLDAGKSYLFSSKPQDLLKGLKTVPLKVKIIKPSDSSLIGQTSIPWSSDFENMVNKAISNSNDNAPAIAEGTFDMENSSLGESSGEISLFIRLSCFGKSIQTQFQVVQRKGIEGQTICKKYLFKSSNAATLFQAQKVLEGDPDSEVLPIAPIYDPADPTTWKGPLKAENMTTEKLNEYLCKNPDCPGARQFKEFGIGPAATGLGLGTVYGPTEIPICYGLSHTYGTLDHYGPYGVYTRPKCLEEPFVGTPVEDCSNTPGCECCSNCHVQEEPPEEEEEAGCQCGDPLRLSGGAPIEDDDCNPCKPMSMCKDLMQSFDKVLSAYKKALGPCGQVSCPVQQSSPSADACKVHCTAGGSRRGSQEPQEPEENQVSACGTPGCPFSRPLTGRANKSFDQSQTKNACGMPTCTYTKTKIGSATDEEVMEMQALQRSSNARSGSKCPMNFMPPLPPLEPIHWDCPDPLPKGPCRNPQCPLKPPECRYNPPCPPPRGPCGNLRCPYSAPPSCGDRCPFSPPQACPYPPPGCPSNPCSPPPCYPPPRCPSPPPSCGSPSCPFSPPPCPSPPPSCGSPSCPFSPPPCPSPAPSCGSPSCPYSPPPCPPPAPSCGSPSCPYSPPPCPPPPPSCGSPSCPYSPPPCPPPSSCGSPSCPYPPPPCPPPPCPPPPCPPPSSCGKPSCPYPPPPCPPPPSCGNPGCPYPPPPCPLPPKVPCGNPACPFAPPPECRPKPRKVICNNAKCPSAADKQSACYVPPEPSDVCENPECPYAPQPDTCTNPECPYVTKTPSPCYIPPPPPSQNMCENPYCPYAPKSPEPCYVPNNAGDICTDPNCPLQLKIPPSCCPPTSPMICPFDDCPFNPDCPPQPEICDNPQCPYAGGAEEVCENPDCPFNAPSVPQEDSICSIPNCPYAKRQREKRDELAKARGDQRGSMGEGEVEVTVGYRDQDANVSPCVPSTCKAEGGTVTCDECEGPVDGDAPKKGSQSAPSLGVGVSKTMDRASASEKVLKKKGRRNKKKSPKLSYKVGDLYPGVNIGHTECIIPGRNVPAKMGWLWNINVPCVGLKPRMGWCPGAVQRTVARRIIAYRKKKGLKLREPLSCKASKKSFKSRDNYQSDSDETVAPKPTLSIKKKDGTFFITMNPLKDPYSIDDNENPYMDCTPMQFKITKNKEVPKQSASQMCFCENEDEPETSSSDSELDIEFTPPAGIIRPDRLRKKKNVVHIDTQYNKADFTPKADKKGKGKGGKGGKGKKGKKGKK